MDCKEIIRCPLSEVCPIPSLCDASYCHDFQVDWLQAAHPTANGTSPPKTAQKVYAKARARNQLSPELLLLIEKDPNQAVGIAVNQVPCPLHSRGDNCTPTQSLCISY
jgi:hypothetical protein